MEDDFVQQRRKYSILKLLDNSDSWFSIWSNDLKGSFYFQIMSEDTEDVSLTFEDENEPVKGKAVRWAITQSSLLLYFIILSDMYLILGDP